MVEAKYIFSNKNIILLKELVRTDFKLRYQNSVLGYSWSLLRPLFLFLILYLVFARFLRLGESIQHYPVYLLLGVVLWTFFAEVTTQSVRSIVDKGDLIRKVKIPYWIIIVSTSISALINLLLNLIIVLFFMIINKVSLSPNSLLLPISILEIYLFAFGLSLWLSTLYVKYRDVSYIWEIILQGLFYLTPIIYSLSLIGKLWMQKIIMINPAAQAIQSSRYYVISSQSTTIEKIYGNPFYILIPLTITAVILISGIILFRKESKYFAENV